VSRKEKNLIQPICMGEKTIVDKPKPGQSSNIKPGKIGIEEPRKSRDVGTN